MRGSGYLQLLLLVAPEIVVALTALLVLLLDLGLLRESTLARRFRATTFIACIGCLVDLLLLTLLPTRGSVAGGMLVVTPITQLVQIAILMLSVLVLLLVSSARFTTHVGEYCGLLLFATTAMMLLVSTQNLLVLFLSIEFLSLSLYVLTAFDKQSQASTEAGLKYFLFGGMSAAFLLFGISLLYGLTSSLTLGPIAEALSHNPGDALLTPAVVMLLAGFGFKVAAAPFHMWAPEVYQGAPTTSAALTASSSKVASFFAFFLVFSIGLPAHGAWPTLLAWVAAVSMVWGNVAAIAQTSVRRLLAYSAIGHAGYMLIAVVVNSHQSLSALVYYVITYALATFGAFAVLFALGGAGADSIADFAGLGKRAPGLSFCLMIFLLSLAGVPPLAGFFGKFYVFVSAVDAEPRQIWLVMLALAMSVVSFYYYLRILKQVYVVEPGAGAAEIDVPATTYVAVWASALLVLLLGCLPGFLLSRIATAIAGSFH
jgi:NADH-quinone oxidoreductase subunit N